MVVHPIEFRKYPSTPTPITLGFLAPVMPDMEYSRTISVLLQVHLAQLVKNQGSKENCHS
jgi:hypothetical protein